jgi:RNA polymerase sigma factor (sigma-70 family)
VGDRSDAELIRGSVNDRELFTVVFDRHYEAIRRFSQARVGEDVGEDIAAEVFVIAFRQRSGYDMRYPSARPWLLGIASNLIRRYARTEQSRLRALTRLPIEGEHPDPIDVDALDAQRLGPLVLHALADLEPSKRETFLLHVVGELTYEEVARIQSIPLGTVRSRIHHVRKAMRERLSLFEAINVWRDDNE